MDLVTNTNLLRQIMKLLDRSKPIESMTTHLMHKPLCPHRTKELMPLPRAVPEEKGVSSRQLLDFFKEIRADKNLDIHGILILKDGCVICDAPFGAYDSEYYHACHSLSKSVTATAIGMLIDEGRISLDDKVVKLLEKRVPPLALLSYKGLTVRHLLSMSSGSNFSEAGTAVEKHWLRAFFESIPRFEPGKTFHYNSLNSYVLSCIVKEVTGQGLRDYLKPRLWDPLGITVYHWETSPEGIEAGGWGLYLRREDAAKIGQLYLNGGLWQGKRLLSTRWIKLSTSAHMQTPRELGDFRYGLHIWTGRERDCYLFNGMFGQDVLIFPKTRTVIVTNGGIEQLFQQSSYYDILFRYFAKDADRTEHIVKRNRRAERKLHRFLTNLKAKEAKPRHFLPSPPLPSFLRHALGKSYCIPRVDPSSVLAIEGIRGTGSISLLPFVEQMLRNRYGKGWESLTFQKGREGLILVVAEGNHRFRLPISPDKTTRTVLRLSDTEYHVAITSMIARDEDGRGVLKLRISFPEIASARFIKIYFEASTLEVRMTEMPGLGLARLFVNHIEQMLRSKKGVAGVVSLVDSAGIFCKVEKTLAPTFFLYAED